MLKIGLTGNIASGKSEVEKILKNKGFFVVDLDIVSHELLINNDKIKKEVLSEFNTINRAELGKIVFNDNSKLKKLEKIIYPKLKEYILDLFKKDYEIIFISGALIYKSGFNELFDKIVYINSTFENRIERLMKRNNLKYNEAKKRIDLQKDNSKLADYVIQNDGSLNELKSNIDSLIWQIKNI